MARRIEGALVATFNYRASVVLRTRKQMQDIVGRAPDGFGAQPAKYRYDVIFLKAPLTASVAMKSVLTKQGVDQAYAGSGVLYFSRLISKAAQSQLSKLVSLPIYQEHDDPQLEHDHDAAADDDRVLVSDNYWQAMSIVSTARSS